MFPETWFNCLDEAKGMTWERIKWHVTFMYDLDLNTTNVTGMQHWLSYKKTWNFIVIYDASEEMTQTILLSHNFNIWPHV